MARLVAVADSFIYVVSTLGVTGARDTVNNELPALLTNIREFTKIPLAVGFGVSNRDHFVHVGKIAEGVVIGSQIIKTIANSGIYHLQRIFFLRPLTTPHIYMLFILIFYAVL